MKSEQGTALTMKNWKSLDPRDEELLEWGHQETGRGGQRLECLRSRIWRLGMIEDNKA